MVLILKINKTISVIQLIKKILGTGAVTDWKALIQNGAQIIDVRTPGEFQNGHIQGSVNIPLQDLSAYIPGMQKGKPVITCCASGMRSASAAALLRSRGLREVYNGGSWTGLQNKIS